MTNSVGPSVFGLCHCLETTRSSSQSSGMDFFFNFSDVRRCTEALRRPPTDRGRVAQLATRVPKREFRQVALRAREQEREAKRLARIASEGWDVYSVASPTNHVLQTGELERRLGA